MSRDSKFLYATLYDSRRLDSPALKAGKQRSEKKTIHFIEDGEVKGEIHEKLEVFTLPERMTEAEIMDWAEENKEKIWGDLGE